MAEISLKDYQAKVERLLRDEHYDEAIYHCRHILKHYPKNVLTYRQLGRALAGAARWREAEEVFLRVLSVYPNEGGAHRGLSQVYMATKQHDKALYHMERAFEQDPTNDKLAGAYRTLFSQIHHVDNPKVPLTSAAIAQQHLKSDLYDQAIDVLRQAIQRSPERADLRLMLAQAYWRSDQPVDAAERALDVLEKLPDSLEANRMLTELWLSQERPFDAVRYLSRLEALDPYLAAELARGQAVPKNSFTLDELDYNLLAAQHMATSSPDWLQSVDAGAVVEAEPEIPADEVSEDDLAALLGEDVADELPAAEPAAEDWLAEIDAMKEIGLEPTLDIRKDEMQKRIDAKIAEQEATEDEDLFEAPSDDWSAQFGDVEPADDIDRPLTPSSRAKTGLTGLLTALAEAESEQQQQTESQAVDDEMPDLFGETGDEGEAVPAEEDVLAWLQDSDADLTADIPAQPVRDNSDPLAWLQGTGVEIVEQEAVTDDAFGLEDDIKLQSLDQTDPLQWLQGSGVEVERDEVEPVAASGDADIEMRDTDPLAWLQGSGVSLEEDSAEPDPLDTARLAAPAETPVLGIGPSSTSWMEDESLLDEMLQLESLTSPEASADVESWVDASVPDEQAVLETEWVEDMAENEPTNWFEDSDSEKAEFDDESQLDGLEWLSQEDPADEEEPAAAEAGTMPDWLSASAPAAAETSAEAAPAAFDANSFDWADDLGVDAEAAPITSEVPDWLGGVEIDAPVDESAEDVATLDWMSNEATPVTAAASSESFDDEQTLGDSGSFNWEEEEPAATSEMPDWLSSVGPVEEEDVAAEPAAVADDVVWDEEQEDAELVSDAPDWLSSVQPAAAATESFDNEQSADWMADQEAPEEEAAVIGEQPDWLSGVSVEQEPVAAASASFDAASLDWSAEVSSEADEEEPAIMGEQPDWLSGVSVEEESVAASESFDDDSLDWSADVSAEADEEEPAVMGEQPHWLSGISGDEQPLTGMESEPYAEPEPEAEFDMYGDEEEPAVMGEQPDWLSGLSGDEQPLTGMESEPFAEPEPEAEFDMYGDEEEPAVMGEQPDWLSGVSVEEEPVAEVDTDSLGADELAWDAEIDTEEAAPVQPAADVPDWLSGVHVEEEPTTEARSVEPDWLSSIGSADEPAEAEAVSEQPEWLSGVSVEDEEPVAEAMSAYEDDEEAALDWMADDGDDDAVAVQSDVPEWLSGVGPIEDEEEPEAVYDMYGDDDEYAEEEPAIAGVPDWLGSIKAQQQAEFDPELENAPGIGGELSWLSDVPTNESAADGEYEPAPAANAPDWLNAMVPGLDVDFDAPEDEPIEHEYARGTGHRSRVATDEIAQTEFGWLTEIVEEETAAMPPVPEGMPTAQAAAPKRRFSFSRLPIWLRRTGALTPQAATPAKPADVPAWLQDASEPADVDEDDFDLPDEWLK